MADPITTITPQDLRPIVKTDAQKIAAAINASALSPIIIDRSNGGTNVTGGPAFVTIGSVTYDKQSPDTALEISAFVSAQNIADAGFAAAQLRVLVNGTPDEHLYAGMSSPNPGRPMSAGLPGILIVGIPAGPVTLALQFVGEDTEIVPDNTEGDSFQIRVQEVAGPLI